MELHRRSSPRPGRHRRLLFALIAMLVFATLPGAAGADEQVSLVRDITPGPESSFLNRFGVLGDTFLFSAQGPEGSSNLWRTDGTADGTTILKEGGTSGGVSFQGQLYFLALNGNVDPATRFSGRDLWRTDGTVAGTEVVQGFGNGSANQLVVANGGLFFTVRLAGSRFATEIWRSDGTAAGTQQLDIGGSLFTRPTELLGATSQLFFRATDQNGIQNLFRTDGTDAGTRQLTQSQQDPPVGYSPIVVGDRLYFNSFQSGATFKVWTSDGTVAGTRSLKSAGTFTGSGMFSQASFGDRLVFETVGLNGQDGAQLFITDGTEAGTQQFFSGPNRLIPQVVDGQLYIQDEQFLPPQDSKIWKSDGTSVGTQLFLRLADLAPPARNPGDMIVFDGAIHFVANTDEFGPQIYRTNGTTTGTRRLTQLIDPTDFASFGTLTPVGDTLYFFAADKTYGQELRKLEYQGGTPPSRVSEGLAALYTFDENSGTTVGDSSGVGAPLNLSVRNRSNTAWVEGGLRLGGVSRLLSSGPASKIIDAAQASDEVTVEAWITPNSFDRAGKLDAQFSARIATISSSSTRRNLSLLHGVFDTNQPSVASARIRTDPRYLDGGRALISPDSSLQDRLTHVVFTRSADGTTRLFIDGAQVAQGSRPGSLSSWNDSYRLALGGEVTGGRYWRGTYYLAAFYGRALSAGEVAQNFEAGPEQP